MFTGGFAAFAAWITSLRTRRQLRELKQYTERLPALLEELKKKPSPAYLDASQKELDELSEWFVERFVTNKISSDAFDSAVTRMTHLNDLIKKRREASQIIVDQNQSPMKSLDGERRSGLESN